MTVLDFWKLTRHNLLLLLAAVLVGLGGGALYSMSRPVLYTSTAVGLMVAGDSSTIGGAVTGTSLAQSRAAAYVPLVTSRSVAERIKNELGSVPGTITGAVVPGSTLFHITAIASTPEKAKELADVAMRATAEEALAVEQVNIPEPQPTTTTKIENGKSVVVPYTPPKGTPVVRLVPRESAVLPRTPFSPNWPLNLGVGALAGLAAGYLVGFIRRSVDVRVRTMADLEETTGHGVLGVIPRAPELKEQRKGGGADLGLAAEALRGLRTNLRFANIDAPPRSIVITSATPGEGKSTVAANLARVLAQAGQPTILVDADLRRPVQHKQFAIDGGVGLTHVLSGDLTLADALVPTEEPNLRVLPAGRIPPNPSEIVGSRRMQNLIKEMARDHIVILDTPPMLPVTDAGLLASVSDGALLIVKVGRTRKEQVRLCARIFQQVGGTLLGAVANGPSPREMGTVMFGYGYGGYASYDYKAKASRAVEKANGKPKLRKGGGASRAKNGPPVSPARAAGDSKVAR